MAIPMKKKKPTRVKKVIKRTTRSKKVVKKKELGSESEQSLIPNVKYIEGIGRRKAAVARVRIYETEGDFIVNNQKASKYFSGVINAVKLYNKPFEITDTKGKFTVTVKVNGSGIKAQLGAVTHGLSRALIKYDVAFRALLKPEGYLTRDDRMKETRKPGRGGKARRKRQSPKR